MLKVGLAKECITPPLNSPLAGFAARQGVAQAIHDDLYARALVLEDDHAALALLSLEVIGLSKEMVKQLRTVIHAKTGIPPQNILCAATHTHCGPVTLRAFFNSEDTIDQEYNDFLLNKAVQSVEQAWHERSLAQIGLGSARISGLGSNRFFPESPADDEVGILKVVDPRGNLRGLLINYGCHPTVLGPNTLHITGDFPSFTLQALEEFYGTHSLALFFNGPQGNVGPGHSSTRSAIGIIEPDRTFDRAGDLGRRLAETVIKAESDIPLLSDVSLSACSRIIKLPWKKYPPSESIEQELKTLKGRFQEWEEKMPMESVSKQEEEVPPHRINTLRLEILYKTIQLYYARQAERFPCLEMEIQAVRIGESAFLALPAEPFTEIGLEIKQSSPWKTYIIALANGYTGYLLTRQAYEKGGYECESSGLAPEAADLFIKNALDLLHSLPV